jgi:exosortase
MGVKMKNPAKLYCAFGTDSISLSLRIITMVAAVVALFYQDLAIVINGALQSDFMSYILVIPFIFIYLLYRKRKMLRAVIPDEEQDQSRANRHLITIVGILFIAAAISLYWYGSHTFTPLQYHMLALPIFVTGLTLIFFNKQTLRQLAFPIAFLIFLVPPPSDMLNAFGSTLSMTSSKASYALATLLRIPSVLTSEYGTPVIQITRPGGATMSFAVDIACSGIYSLIGFLIFSVFVAFIMRGKLWKKLILFASGFLLIYALNITRITTILVIGYYYGEETALQLFHLLGGWVLIFAGTLLLLILAERAFHAQVFTKSVQNTNCIPKLQRGEEFCLNCGKILKPERIRFRKSEIIKAMAVIVTVALLISLQTPTFALVQSPAEIMIQTPTGQQGNPQLLPQVQGYTKEFYYRDLDFEKISGQDASLVYLYTPLDKSKGSVWVTIEIGTSTSMLHDWEFCLISWPISIGLPATVTQLSSKDVLISQNPPIIGRYFAFKWTETNQTQVVLYWYEDSIFTVGNTTQTKSVKISLITYPDTPQSLTPAEDLLPFATGLTQYWEPIKLWSEISLFLSQESIYFVAATLAMLLIVLILYIGQRKKQVRANAKAYQKLSASTKTIIDLIVETEKTAKPTLHAIASTYKDKTGDFVDSEEMLLKLSEVQKTGIVKSEIANVYDEPTKVWKNQLKLFPKKLV